MEEERDDVAKHGDKGAVNGTDNKASSADEEEVKFDEDALAKWIGKNISKVDACSKCKYAFFCGGGCMAGALREGRGYNSPHCDGYPKLFQDIVPHTYFNYLEEVEKVKNGEITEISQSAPIQVM